MSENPNEFIPASSPNIEWIYFNPNLQHFDKSSVTVRCDRQVIKHRDLSEAFRKAGAELGVKLTTEHTSNARVPEVTIELDNFANALSVIHAAKVNDAMLLSDADLEAAQAFAATLPHPIQKRLPSSGRSASDILANGNGKAQFGPDGAGA